MPKIFKYGNVFIGESFPFLVSVFLEWIHDAIYRIETAMLGILQDRCACSLAIFALSSTPSLSTIAENSTQK